MNSGYEADLAYIHHRGYADFAHAAAPAIMRWLRLFSSAPLHEMQRDVGFVSQRFRGYGKFRLRPGHYVFRAGKTNLR